MNSLQDLNAWGNTAIQFADDRPTVVTFTAVTSSQILEIDPPGETAYTFPAGVDIVNPSQSVPDNCTYVIDTENSDVAISWPDIPQGFTVDTVPGDDNTYRITGAFTPDFWDRIAEPQVVVPSNYFAEGLYQAQVVVGNETRAWAVSIKTVPELAGAFYLLDSSGNYTGTVPVTDVYFNQFPYFDIQALSSADQSFADNAVDTLGVTWTNNVGQPYVYEIDPETLAVPDLADKGLRYVNYYEDTDWAIQVNGGVSNGGITQTATVTAVTNHGLTAQQQYTINVYVDTVQWAGTQDQWTEPFSNFYQRFSEWTEIGTRYQLQDTGNIQLIVSHYPDFAYSFKAIDLDTFRIDFGSADGAVYNFSTGTFFFGDPESETLWDSAEITVTLAGVNIITKDIGQRNPTVAIDQIDITNLLSATVISPQQDRIQALPLAFDVSVDGSVDPFSNDMAAQLSISGFERIQINNNFGPDFEPVWETHADSKSFQIKWIQA